MMRYRSLSATGYSVSEIGFGTWGIGGTSYGKVDDGESRMALEAAFDLGINFFDTADLYGNGHSEELLASVFKDRRQYIIIATKGGTLPHTTFHMPQDFSPAYLRRALENSLKRLRTDYIDIYLLHSPPLDRVLGNDELLQTLEAFKSEGLIKVFGVSARTPQDAMQLLDDYRYDVIEINLNIIDHRAPDIGLFERASKLDIGIIARTPLAFGFLSGRLSGNEDFSQNDHRGNWPRSQLKRWANAHQYFSFLYEGTEISPTQAALKFCLQFDTVSTVIPGMMKASEVEENAKVPDIPQFSNEVMARIKQIYSEHNNDFYDTSFQKVGDEEKD